MSWRNRMEMIANSRPHSGPQDDDSEPRCLYSVEEVAESGKQAWFWALLGLQQESFWLPNGLMEFTAQGLAEAQEKLEGRSWSDAARFCYDGWAQDSGAPTTYAELGLIGQLAMQAALRHMVCMMANEEPEADLAAHEEAACDWAAEQLRNPDVSNAEG